MSAKGYAVYRGQAHRFFYELLVGPIPDGMVLDHTCHNRDLSCAGGNDCRHRRCVNPAHMDPTTPGENTLRSTKTNASVNAAKTHCPHGHPYDEENTSIYGKKQARFCKTCWRARPTRTRAR